MNTLIDPPGSSARKRFSAIYTTIRERISLLDYVPGQRLSEEALAREFGTSRTPLRRVLARLENEGLVQSVQSVGTIVTDVDIEVLAQTYRLRMELAELVGQLDPVPVTSEILDLLRALIAQINALHDQPDAREFARLNIAFFHLLLDLTENEPLREISERLYYRTARIWIRSICNLNMDREIAIFEQEVTDVLVALEVGDLASVGHIRRAHISMSFWRLQRNTGAKKLKERRDSAPPGLMGERIERNIVPDNSGKNAGREPGLPAPHNPTGRGRNRKTRA